MEAVRSRKNKIVCDYAFSPASLVFPEILGKLNIETVSLNGVLHPLRTSKTPDEFKNSLDTVSKLVSSIKADLGVMLDVGGEKVFFVDGRGHRVNSQKALLAVLTLLPSVGPLLALGFLAIPPLPPGFDLALLADPAARRWWGYDPVADTTASASPWRARMDPANSGNPNNDSPSDRQYDVGHNLTTVNHDDLFMRVYSQKDGANPRHTKMTWPAGDISFLHAIPAIGTKFKPAEQYGPQSRKFSASGTYSGTLYFYFGLPAAGEKSGTR